MLQVMSMYCRLVVVMKPQSARACPELRGSCRSPAQIAGGQSEWRCCERRRRPGETGVVGGRKDEGLFGEDGEDGGVRGSDGVEQVDGGIANDIMAVDMEELTGRAGPGAPTLEDAGRSKRRMRRDNVYSMGERKEYRP